MGLIFEYESRVVLKLGDHVVELLNGHVQMDARATEAGGVILGRWLVAEMCFIADEISEPVADDRRTRTSFFRSAGPHAQMIVESLHRSRDTCGYLGEWHTHPEPDPRPSNVDLADWRRRLRVDRVDIPWVFFVIVGTAKVAAWMGERSRAKIHPLRPHISSSDARQT